LIRIALLVLVVAAAWLYLFPSARGVAADVARPVLTPVFRWQARQEMTSIAHEMQIYERENLGRIPDARRFQGWLESSFAGDATMDSWGTPYSLRLSRDSFAIESWGPDRTYDTDDDMHLARRRSGVTH
jgi:hypothetical protein